MRLVFDLVMFAGSSADTSEYQDDIFHVMSVVEVGTALGTVLPKSRLHSESLTALLLASSNKHMTSQSAVTENVNVFRPLGYTERYA